MSREQGKPARSQRYVQTMNYLCWTRNICMPIPQNLYWVKELKTQSTDEGSSPKRLVIQALGYILNLTKFMYLLVIIAARTNKHFMSKKN